MNILGAALELPSGWGWEAIAKKIRRRTQGHISGSPTVTAGQDTSDQVTVPGSSTNEQKCVGTIKKEHALLCLLLNFSKLHHLEEQLQKRQKELNEAASEEKEAATKSKKEAQDAYDKCRKNLEEKLKKLERIDTKGTLRKLGANFMISFSLNFFGTVGSAALGGILGGQGAAAGAASGLFGGLLAGLGMASFETIGEGVKIYKHNKFVKRIETGVDCLKIDVEEESKTENNNGTPTETVEGIQIEIKVKDTDECNKLKPKNLFADASQKLGLTQMKKKVLDTSPKMAKLAQSSRQLLNPETVDKVLVAAELRKVLFGSKNLRKFLLGSGTDVVFGLFLGACVEMLGNSSSSVEPYISRNLLQGAFEKKAWKKFKSSQVVSPPTRQTTIGQTTTGQTTTEQPAAGETPTEDTRGEVQPAVEGGEDTATGQTTIGQTTTGQTTAEVEVNVEEVERAAAATASLAKELASLAKDVHSTTVDVLNDLITWKTWLFAPFTTH